MLTGERGREVDIAAMEAGASDFLLKGKSDAQLVERTIRYAVTHAQAMAALRRSYRQVAGIEEVGRHLSRSGPTPEALEEILRVLAWSSNSRTRPSTCSTGACSGWRRRTGTTSR